MRLRLRLLWILLSSLWRHRLHVLDESIITLPILPNDVDAKAATNDRFLAFMDLGRLDFIARAGFLRRMVRRRWVPIVTFTTIRYRQPLKLFRAYQLHSRTVYWDDRAFYFEQHFKRHGRVVATGYVCGVVRGPHGLVSPDTILGAASQHVRRPERTDIVARLQDGEADIQQLQQTDAHRVPV